MLFAVPAGAQAALPYAVVAAALVLAVAVLGTMRGRGARAALWTALVACLGAIAWLTIGDAVTTGETGGSGLNLTLFQEIERALRTDSDHVWLNIIGNVAMFAPLGAVVVALLRGNVLVRLMAASFLGAALSGVIEIAQLALGRVADIDDVLLNTVGAFGGAVVAALIIGVTRGFRGAGYDGPRASSSVGRAADF